MSLSKDSETKGIKAILILEMIGRPPKHMIETLEGIIKQIDEEKGVEIREKKISEPVLIKDQKDFYTSFAEIEIEVEEILTLAILMFKYMPAHIEITSPELIALTNNGWNDIFNELTRRLHGYDEIARVLQFQNAEMQKQLDSETKPQVSSSENIERKELIPEEKKDEQKEEGKK